MARRIWQIIQQHLRDIFDPEAGRLILYSPLVGVVAGLGALLFFLALNATESWVLGRIEGYYPPPAGTEVVHQQPTHLPENWLAVFLIPAIGGLLCGLVVYTWAPEAEGHGTDAMIRAFHQRAGRIRARVPLVKAVASILTIGTGGSAGREGPIAQIGAGFGSFLATRLGLNDRDRRLLMLAGAAGGIGAIFRAPLGGALFVAEVLYASTVMESAAVIPAFIASITAYTIFTTAMGPGLAFVMPRELVFRDFRELPFYLVFALLCPVMGYVYVRCFYGLRDRVFRPLPVPNWLKPALGGLGLGAVALGLPQVMAGGYGWIQEALHGRLTWQFMALLCIGKIVATSLTISSGGSGGVFAPSLFIGAMLGGAFGALCHKLAPGIIDHPEAFVLVGMGGFFAGVAKVPLTSILMVCEMSGSYGLLVPLMLVAVIHLALSSPRCSLYEEQVLGLVDSPAHQGDFVVDVLEQIRVKEIMDPSRKVDLVRQDMPLRSILSLAANSRNAYFPVVDENNRMIGIFSLRDLRSVLTGDGAAPLVVALDIATQPVLTVTPEDDLHTALRRFTQKNIDELPVVDPKDPQRVIGMISRRDVIAAYHDRVTELQQEHSRQYRPAARP